VLVYQYMQKTRREGNWHARAAEEVLTTLESSPEGLTSEEAKRRRKQYGANAFSSKKPPSAFVRFASQLVSPFSLVLIGALVVTIALAEYLDASVVAFALLVAAVVGVLQEGRASKAFSALARSQTPTATVVRDGARKLIDAHLLTVGDIVLLEAGVRVPADVRLLEAHALSINESALTGEWLAVEKGVEAVALGAPFVEKVNMAWMGTYVSSGYGTGVVVAVGHQTEVGKIATDLDTIVDAKTPLQREMRRVSQIILAAILVIVAGIFAFGTLAGMPLSEILLTSVALAVSSVPEGLPAAVTIVLAVAMESLLRRGGLVRSLLAAETLGSTTYVLTDKTGTLTEGKMEAVALELIADGGTFTRERASWHEGGAVCALFETALCASDAYLEEREDQASFVLRGEPMERAILEAAQCAGVTTAGESMRGRRIDFHAFDPELRFAAGLAPEGGEEGMKRLCLNGAPEQLLAAATTVHTEEGVKPLTDSLREALRATVDARTARGERLLAVAYRRVSWSALDTVPVESLDEDLTLVGLIAFHDPVRDDVGAAIAGVRRAGAQVVLVTGDNPNTARSVAQQAGIVKAKGEVAVLLGSDIEELDDAALIAALKDTLVFARVLPREKMRIAEVLQTHGEVVAMTGDGVNDSPALRAANIGVALGSGTEVAKEAADLVLVNDSFSIIYAAIEEGRRVVANLRKIVGYLLTTSMSEVALVSSALVVGAPIPILPAQILWANVIEEGLMSVAFAFEPGEKRSMEGRRQERRILSGRMLAFITLAATVMSTLLILLYLYIRAQGAPIEEVRSVMFLAVAVDSLFIAFSFRTLATPIFKVGFRGNTFFLISFAISLVLLLVVLTIPFFQQLLSYQPLPAFDVLLVIGYGFVTLLTIEVGKWIFFERRRS
jgi:Ca2+-transporting ATPase